MERAAQGVSLLQEQGHRTIGDLPSPQQEKGVPIGCILYKQTDDSHKDIRMDLEHIPGQRNAAVLHLQLLQLCTEGI